ncbi:hypothetical protein HDU97_006807 [Phlyctochytrium planicorne]|nr:hypothetical protein HDU97_006807 [Phlyctochytrium planicorne]
MYISNILFAATALAATASAAVIPGASQPAFSTSIHKKASKMNPVQRAIKSLDHIHAKHGVKNSISSSVSGAKLNVTGPVVGALAGTSSSPLSNDADFVYFVDVSVGNGQKFSLDLDTGSSDTWVRGPQCKINPTAAAGDASCTGTKLNLSDRTISSTGATFTTGYGSGEVTGRIISTRVAIGGAVANNLLIGSSTVEKGFTGSDGLVGLAFSQLSNIGEQVSGQTNFFDALGLSGSQNQFGFYFSNSVDGDNGEVTFGGFNSEKIAGPITYVPLNSETYWQFSASDITFGAGSTTGRLGLTDAISDTGTSLILLDRASANSINSAIGAGPFDTRQGIYPISCSTSGRPDVVFNIGSGTFTLPPSAYIIADGSGGCISGITSPKANQNIRVGIFGDIFLRRYYSIYDKTNSRVGFALAKHPGTPSNPGGNPGPAPCAHSICTTGVALTSSCDPCAAKIIARDSFCATDSWDSQCVREVGSICSLSC